MLHIIENAARRFRQNFKFYVFIILEIAISLCIVISGINASLAMKSKLQQQNEAASGKSVIEIQCVTATEKAIGNPISYKAYEKILNNLPNSTQLNYLLFAQAQLSENIGINLVFISSRLLENYLGVDVSEQTAFFGEDLSQYIKNKESQINNEIFLDGQSLKIKDMSYALKPLPSDIATKEIPFTNVSFDKIDVANTLFIPCEALSYIQNDEGRAKLVLLESESDTSQHIEVASQLKNENSTFDYMIVNPQDSLEKGANDSIAVIKSLSWYAGYSFFILIIGTIGVMLVLLSRRRKDIAICLTLGATMKAIVTELYLEVCFVCGLGAVLGMLFAYPITAQLTNVYFTVAFNPLLIPLSLLCMAAISLLICSLTVLSITDLNPLKILKEE